MFRPSIYLGIITLCSVFTTAHAQNIRGNLEGQVVDANAKPLPAVNITVSGDDVQGRRGATTNEHGFFRILALPVGHVTIDISHIGHQTVKYENVAISLGKMTTLGKVRLTPKTIELSAVVVTRSKPVIDPNSTTVSANISAAQFEALPTGRDYLSITTLLPQANVSFLGDDVNIAGATGQENAYFIDGMNTTDPLRAIGGTQLPYNFVKEVEVKSGGYEAEFGRATGGIVNVITYSGGNEFEAKAFGFFTNNNLADDGRRGFVDLGTGDFQRYDVGLSLGGPIVRDKLWYFLAYNNKIEKEDLDLEGLGTRIDKNVVNIFAGKLTWQATARTNLTLSMFGDPSKWERVGHNWVGGVNPSALANPDPFLGDWRRGGVNLSLKGSHIVKDNLQLEIAASRYSADWVAEASTDRGRLEPLLIDNTTGIWSGGYGAEFDRQNTRNAASLAATYFFREHTVKAGVQFEDNIFDEDWRWLSQGPDSAGIILKLAEDYFRVLPLDFQSRDRNRVVSFFAQGSLALHPRLRLNAGLRWDGQYFTGLDTGLGGSITDQFHPRVGFVFQPGEIGKQKVTGSFGRFYEQIPNQVVSFAFGNLTQGGVDYGHNPLEDPSGGVVLPLFRKPGDNIFDEGLKGQYFDEFTLGYERQISNDFKVGARVVHRTLREIVENGDDPNTPFHDQTILGNPGRGLLSHIAPRPQRDYTALEITLEKSAGDKVHFLTSYVLSRSYGNATGVFNSDTGIDLPNSTVQFDNALQLVNGTGLLPNDRTHVFKFNGAYRFDFGLLAGTSFLWQRGTPLSEIGAHPATNFSYTFVSKRGTVGRTPSIWDLNLRFSHHLNRLFRTSFKQKLILDIFHLFSQGKAAHFEQRRFFAVDQNTGEQINENPNYLKPITFQPPMTVRLGLEFGF